MSTNVKCYYDKEKLIEWKIKHKGKKLSMNLLHGAACGKWTCRPSRACSARDKRLLEHLRRTTARMRAPPRTPHHGHDHVWRRAPGACRAAWRGGVPWGKTRPPAPREMGDARDRIDGLRSCFYPWVSSIQSGTPRRINRASFSTGRADRRRRRREEPRATPLLGRE